MIISQNDANYIFISKGKGNISMTNDMIRAQMNKSNGMVKIVKAPKNKRLTKQSLHKLDEEIRSQVNANKDMERRSIAIAKLSGVK